MNWNNASEYTPHPAGNFMAVCVDVYDRVEKNHFFGKADKEGKVDQRETVKVAYVDFYTSQGKRIHFRATATLGKPDKQSNLRKFIKTWNPAVTDRHLIDFDPNSMVGWGAYITVTHTEKNGRVYDNVVGAMQPPPNNPGPTIPASFVRFKDRDKAQPVATTQPATNDPVALYDAKAPANVGPGAGDDDDGLPF